MADVQQMPSAKPRQSLKPGQAFIIGRVSEVKRSENATYTIIQTPAPDAFSHPGNHEVSSSRLIGKPGEDIEVVVQLGGYRRSYKNKHGETVATVDNVLRVVEE